MASKNYDAKYETGDTYSGQAKKVRQNFLSNPSAVIREILADSHAVRQKFHFYDLLPLLNDLIKKGEPLDDKKGTTEQLIAILQLLSPDSQLRTDLTNTLIDSLWDNLQHPPLSYLGGNVRYEEAGKAQTAAVEPESIKFQSPLHPEVELVEQVPTPPNAVLQYRTPDGSYNNILSPDLGRAGTPYAKSVRTDKRLAGAKPDPGLLFDLLMARGDDFKENKGGVSAMLFYHASIIIHDVFRTNRADSSISDTSSYLDLAPLYGSSLQDQLEIRTMQDGMLKPDTFSEKRLLGQPPGVNVLLVLYSRFHNYVADVLKKINEGGRFTLALPPQEQLDKLPEHERKVVEAKAAAKQDHDLFNVARLVVNGLYINISLHDYLRAITNTHSSASNWTLDPRVEIDKHFDGHGTPRGIGNQVSAEFNLLYRFHSCISKKDEKWTEDFFSKQVFQKPVAEIYRMDQVSLLQGLGKAFAALPKEPWKREFRGFKRGKDGKFNDADLANCLQASMDDPAGIFGARQVPKILRVVEVLGILQAREWQVASLNEFREFFGLKRHQTFSDINSDAQIANILERLYTHPDMVELYPGLMIEDAKPDGPGTGINPTYSVGRAILSDAITLVRSDRFNTIDYNVSNLTAWGFNEVQQDYKTLGGSMFYRLIQRGLPGWFPYNSINVMQPMYTGAANARIFKSLGTFKQFTMDGAKPPRKTIILTKDADCRTVLRDHTKFAVPWLPPINDILGGERDIGWYMLAGDGPANKRNRELSERIFYKENPSVVSTVKHFVDYWGRDWINKAGFKLKEGMYEIDILRDVVIPLDARFASDLFYFDLRTPDENPSGALSYADVYRNLLNIRIWGSNSADTAQSWNRRRWAQESVRQMIETSRPLVQEIANEQNGGLFNMFSSLMHESHGSHIKEGSLRSIGRYITRGFVASGMTVDQIVDNSWLNGFGTVGNIVTLFAECLEFFLKAGNEKIWARVQAMASKGDDNGIRKYVMEAQRLTSRGRTARVSKISTTIGGQKVSPGDVVVILLNYAGLDPDAVDSPNEFKPNRWDASPDHWPMQGFSDGIHQCFGREIALAIVGGIIKLVAGLKDLRQAPGYYGQLKSIQLGSEKCFLNENWSYLTTDPTTWKLHYSGVGKGTYTVQEKPKEARMSLRQTEFIHNVVHGIAKHY